MAQKKISLKLDLPEFASETWGPPVNRPPAFADLPFAPFSKRDPINYIADWNATTKSKDGRTKMGDEQATLGNFSEDEASEFGVVVRQKTYDMSKQRKDFTKQRQQMQYAHMKLTTQALKQLREAPSTVTRAKKQAQKRQRRKKYFENLRPTIASIKKQDHWSEVKDMWFNPLLEIKVNIPKQTKTLVTAGTIHGVLSNYDEIRCRTPVKLNVATYNENNFMSFNYKTTSKDPIILELANKGVGNVFATDEILSVIMCCNRSKYSYDIVINKLGNDIFFDQRLKANSSLSVDETSQYRPTKKTAAPINRYLNLAKEATLINHCVQEQLVSHRIENQYNLQRKHPFAEAVDQKSGKESTSTAFVYRQIIFGEDINLIVRCGVQGYDMSNKQRYIDIYALNQYDHTKSKTDDWNKELDTRLLAILLTEIRNNNFKFARWATQAHLAGIETIKLAFVTRVNSNDATEHHIVGVKNFTLKDIIQKMGLELTHEWGVLNHFIKLIRDLDDGRYIGVRDPLKQVIRIYRVDDDAFINDDLPTLTDVKNRLPVSVFENVKKPSADKQTIKTETEGENENDHENEPETGNAQENKIVTDAPIEEPIANDDDEDNEANPKNLR